MKQRLVKIAREIGQKSEDLRYAFRLQRRLGICIMSGAPLMGVLTLLIAALISGFANNKDFARTYTKVIALDSNYVSTYVFAVVVIVVFALAGAIAYNGAGALEKLAIARDMAESLPDNELDVLLQEGDKLVIIPSDAPTYGATRLLPWAQLTNDDEQGLYLVPPSATKIAEETERRSRGAGKSRRSYTAFIYTVSTTFSHNNQDFHLYADFDSDVCDNAEQDAQDFARKIETEGLLTLAHAEASGDNRKSSDLYFQSCWPENLPTPK